MDAVPASDRLAELTRALNQAEVARLLGATRKRVNKLFRGLAQPTVGEVQGLAKIIRVPVDELVALFAEIGEPTEVRRAS